MNKYYWGVKINKKAIITIVPYVDNQHLTANLELTVVELFRVNYFNVRCLLKRQTDH